LPPEIEPRSADISAVVQGTFHSVVLGTKCAALDTLAQNGIEALEVQSEGATLEDAFVKLTGRHIHEEKTNQTP
jgi:hypothetical protein